MDITPRSKAEGLYNYRYEVQEKTHSYNWYTVFASDDLESSFNQARFFQDRRNTEVRIIDNEC